MKTYVLLGAYAAGVVLFGVGQAVASPGWGVLLAVVGGIAAHVAFWSD